MICIYLFLYLGLYRKYTEYFDVHEVLVPNRDKVYELFEIQNKLWSSYSEWLLIFEYWKTSDFRSLMATEVVGASGAVHLYGIEMERIIEDFYSQSKSIERLVKIANISDNLLLVVEGFKSGVVLFKQMMSLIIILGSPALKERHWSSIFSILGENWNKGQFSLSYLVELRAFAPQYLDQIENITATAVKEWSFEKGLSTMKEAWDGVSFTFTPYKESGTHILISIDEIQMLLDDHIVKTQAMNSSPFAKPFEKELKAWDKKLKRILNVLENWLKVQAIYLYLDPIFRSVDIQNQMPNEAFSFREVDKLWRKNAKQCVEATEVLLVAEIEGLIEALLKQNELLEDILKGLTRYLETKRLYFPRFYFLSNDELLEILSETADPLRVQPFLKKCFEGINLLVFDRGLNIMAMQSPEEEEVKFNQYIYI